MNRVWLSLALLCVSVGGYADDAASSYTDLSMKYLGQIFGEVPGALNGSGTGLVGGLFSIFNEGVMAVAAIWLMYTITQVLLTTATSDNPQKSIKNWTLWTRVVFGFGLLVPGPSGYCLAQELMMKVVVQGVKLADKTWSYALDYMKDGNLLYAPQGDLAKGGIPSMKDADAVRSELKGFLAGTSYSSPTGSIQGSLAYKIYNAQVCMYASNTFNQKNKDNAGKPDAATGARYNYQMHMVTPEFDGNNKLKAGTGVINFPGYKDTNQTSDNNCGTVTLPSDVQSLNQTQVQQAYSAMAQAAIDIAPYARQMADHAYNGSSQPSVDVGGQYLFTSVLDYLKLMEPVATFFKDQGNHDADDDIKFISQANQQGWFNAGGFYWDMMRLNNTLAEKSGRGNPAQYVPAVSAVASSIPDQVTSVMATAGEGLTTDPSAWGKAQDLMVQYSTGNTSNASSHKNVSTHVLMIADMGIITGPLTTLLSTLNSQLSGVNSLNPMLISYNVGKAALSAAGTMWAIMIPILTVLSAIAGICDSANPGNVIFKGLISWLQPLVFVSSGFLFTAGVMLTFYVPLYPYLLFLFGVVGWLLYVIESMVAAPLVAFGMSHPEGHDFMGRAEQALMLALGVFLRPTLMIIGYLVGAIMVYVTSSFLNMVLGQVFVSTYSQQYRTGVGDGLDGMWDVLTQSSDPGSQWVHGQFTGNMISDAILVPVVLTIYSMIMIEVVNQCFSAIHQVPDMVLRWIGGPVQQDQSAQHAQAIKGAVSAAGQQGSQAMGEVGKSMMGIGQAGNQGLKKGLDKAGEGFKKLGGRADDDNGNLADPSNVGNSVSGAS